MENYSLLAKQLLSLIETDNNWLPTLSNFSALIMENLENLNWVGFYFKKNSKLVLGPFQGKIACIHIPFDKGVCGSAFSQGKTLVVDDVHKFPGHIACDSASNSEIVIPIKYKNEIIGVLDIDSPIKRRFSTEDKIGLENLVKILEKEIDFTPLF